MQQIIAKFGPYILSFVIAVISFLGGSVTSIGDAVHIAIDKDSAIEQAAEILADTPPSEVKDALAE